MRGEKWTDFDLTKSLSFASPSKTTWRRSMRMDDSRYVTVERVVLDFDKADLTRAEGDAAGVGVVVRYAFRMTMAGRAATSHVAPAKRRVKG